MEIYHLFAAESLKALAKARQKFALFSKAMHTYQ